MRITFRLLLPALAVFAGASCAHLPDNNQRTPGYTLPDTENTAIARSIKTRRDKDTPQQRHSGLFLLGNGIDAFITRIAMARMAEKSLDVQYYLYHSDLSGTLLTRELWRAAERGVRIRMLLDDMDTAGKDKKLATLNAHKNIEIRIFNPFIRGKFRAGQFLTDFGSITRRAHNKAMIADNAIGIVGGRNVGDEYFSADPNLEFGDLDVAVTNPAVQTISAEFDLYWNNQLAYPIETLVSHVPTQQELNEVELFFDDFYERNKESIYVERLQHSKILQHAQQGTTPYHWGDVKVLYDHPDKLSTDRAKKQYNLTPKLKPYLASVKKELIVISPYFVPGEEGVEFFRDLESRGVEVKVLTNSLMSNDVPIVHAGYSKYRKQLLTDGVELFELDYSAIGKEFRREKKSKTREGLGGSKASLHAKYFVMDRESAFIGSLNLDPRSIVENTEIGVVIDAASLAQKLGADFDMEILQVAFELKLEHGEIIWQRHAADGSLETFRREPDSSWWDRFRLGFMKLLPAESQL